MALPHVVVPLKIAVVAAVSAIALVWDPTVVAAAVVTIVVALFAGVTTVLAKLGDNARQARNDERAIAAQKAIADLATQLAVILSRVETVVHTTDGAATRDASMIESQQVQLAMMRETINKLETTATTLARSVAVAPTVRADGIAAGVEQERLRHEGKG